MTSESQAKVNSTNWARVLTHSVWKVFQWILAFLWMPIVAIIIRDIPTKCVKQPPSKEDPEGKLILTGGSGVFSTSVRTVAIIVAQKCLDNSEEMIIHQ